MYLMCKIIILSCCLLGCSVNKQKKIELDPTSATYDGKLIEFYQNIKDEKYRSYLYEFNNDNARNLEITKLYRRYKLNLDQYSKYVRSLEPNLSYIDYSSALNLKVKETANQIRGFEYAPGEVFKKTKLSQLSNNFFDGLILSEKKLMENFYDILKKNNGLTEFRLVFKKKSDLVDYYNQSIVIYLYKTDDGEEFILDPQLLVSNNF